MLRDEKSQIGSERASESLTVRISKQDNLGPQRLSELSRFEKVSGQVDEHQWKGTSSNGSGRAQTEVDEHQRKWTSTKQKFHQDCQPFSKLIYPLEALNFRLSTVQCSLSTPFSPSHNGWKDDEIDA